MNIKNAKSFDVDPIIRKVQEVELEMLVAFDEICKKHDLPYQLYGGTLLGAIRHQGFIPWDDDIDVCMLRKDYEVFINVASKELNSTYFLQTYKTDENFFNSYAKIRKNKTLLVEDDTADIDMHKGIFIDVFPLDNVKYKSWQGELQRKTIFYLQVINQTKLKKTCYKEKNVIKKNIMLFFHYLLKILPNHFIDKIIDKLSIIYNGKETQYMSDFGTSSHSVMYHNFIIDRDEFDDSIPGNFESHSFPIPRNFDSILTRNYGDYMSLPPEDKRISHHGITQICFNTD